MNKLHQIRGFIMLKLMVPVLGLILLGGGAAFGQPTTIPAPIATNSTALTFVPGPGPLDATVTSPGGAVSVFIDGGAGTVTGTVDPSAPATGDPSPVSDGTITSAGDPPPVTPPAP